MIWPIKEKGPDACSSPSGVLREKAICMMMKEPFFSKYGNVGVTINLLMGQLSLRGLKVMGPEQLASINSDAGKAKTIQYFFSLLVRCFLCLSLSPDNRKSW